MIVYITWLYSNATSKRRKISAPYYFFSVDSSNASRFRSEILLWQSTTDRPISNHFQKQSISTGYDATGKHLIAQQALAKSPLSQMHSIKTERQLGSRGYRRCGVHRQAEINPLTLKVMEMLDMSSSSYFTASTCVRCTCDVLSSNINTSTEKTIRKVRTDRPT